LCGGRIHRGTGGQARHARRVGQRELCQTEIQNFDVVVARYKNVFWFQIPMEDAAIVSSSQALKNLPCIFDCSSHRQRAFPHPRAQTFAFQQFRNDVREVVLPPDIKNSEDIRMIESGRGP
jgi:hypothetical protein